MFWLATRAREIVEVERGEGSSEGGGEEMRNWIEKFRVGDIR